MNIDGSEISDLVRKQVSKWTSKYSFNLQHISVEEIDIHKFQLSFSIFEKHEPIPPIEGYIYVTYDTHSKKLYLHFEDEDQVIPVMLASIPQSFEKRIDRLISLKSKVKDKADLTTDFDRTRLKQEIQPVRLKDIRKIRYSDEMWKKDKPLSVFSSETINPINYESIFLDARSDPDYLWKVLDSADEEGVGVLECFQIYDLLRASELDLCDWDKFILLQSIPICSGNLMSYIEWTKTSINLVQEIQNLRKIYNSKIIETEQIKQYQLQLCFEYEFEQLARQLNIFSEELNPKGNMNCSKLSLIQESLCHRLSPQELKAIKTWERPSIEGHHDSSQFRNFYISLRYSVHNNTIFESNKQALENLLRKKFDNICKEDPSKLKIWNIREALCELPNLIPSRTQIHVILSILFTDDEGMVDRKYALETIRDLFLKFYDPKFIHMIAQIIEDEKLELNRNAQLVDFNIKSATIMNESNSSRKSNIFDKNDTAGEIKNIERTLTHLFKLLDDKHSGYLNPARIISAMKDSPENDERHNKAIKNCNLSDYECRGFVAEAVISDEGGVKYTEHVKTWIPILFELRNSKFYSRIFADYENIK